MPTRNWLRGCVMSSALLVAGPALAAQLELLVTQTNPGSSSSNAGAVLEYTAASSTSPLVFDPLGGIPASGLNDPASVLYDPFSARVFVGNRHGNSGPASISVFIHNPGGAFTFAQTISGNGLLGVHELALSPTTGELFAANVNTGISRFLPGPGGSFTANGTLAGGPIRGLMVSPDGTRLFATEGISNTIRVFDLTTNTELSSISVPGALGLHFMSLRGPNELWITAFGSSSVHGFTIGAGNALSPLTSLSASGAIDVTFSPDLDEMFVSGHASGIITRYSLVATTWTPNGTLTTGSSLGGITAIAIPEASTTLPAAGGLALLALRRRRRQ